MSFRSALDNPDDENSQRDQSSGEDRRAPFPIAAEAGRKSAQRSLLEVDALQWRRIEAAIAAFAAQPASERKRKIHLLRALENEKEELLRCNPAIRMMSSGLG